MKTPAYRCTVTIMHLFHVINIMIGYISCSSLIGKNMVQLCKKQQASPDVSQNLKKELPLNVKIVSVVSLI